MIVQTRCHRTFRVQDTPNDRGRRRELRLRIWEAWDACGIGSDSAGCREFSSRSGSSIYSSGGGSINSTGEEHQAPALLTRVRYASRGRPTNRRFKDEVCKDYTRFLGRCRVGGSTKFGLRGERIARRWLRMCDSKGRACRTKGLRPSEGWRHPEGRGAKRVRFGRLR